MKKDNINISLKIREEESEGIEKMHQRVEEEEEEKEDQKVKLPNNKLQLNKLLNSQPPEHVLCELLFNLILHFFFYPLVASNHADVLKNYLQCIFF